MTEMTTSESNSSSSKQYRAPRVADDGAGDGHPLLLPAAKLRSALAAHSVVAIGQRLNESVGVGSATGGLDLGVKKFNPRTGLKTSPPRQDIPANNTAIGMAWILSLTSRAVGAWYSTPCFDRAARKHLRSKRGWARTLSKQCANGKKAIKHLLLGRIFLSVAHVCRDGGREEDGLLRAHARRAAVAG
jgi:DNA-binding IclR family transcriptional regulator